VTASRDESTGRLVHDLRTPLTLILGFAEMLHQRHGELSPEQSRQNVEWILKAARDMQEILDRAG
jgi:K+-sensing histidine kinase KdpD